MKKLMKSLEVSALLVAALALLLCATPLRAQEPEYDYWINLPVVMRGYRHVYPTPTPTVRPTLPPPTATPTPRPIPQGVYILPNHSYYTGQGYLWVGGEVQNNTSDYLQYVKIAVNIFSSDNQLVDTRYTYVHLNNLSPGEKTCFKIWFSQEPGGWSYYRFEVPSYWTKGNLPPNLALLTSSGSYNTDGSYTILGQVRNDQGTTVEYVSVIGTLYNAAGTVIGCGNTYVNSTDLDPDQTSSFKMKFWSWYRDHADVASYRLQADGY